MYIIVNRVALTQHLMRGLCSW